MRPYGGACGEDETMRAIKYILAAAVAAGVGAADAMKSDPANYYLDPEEIRPIVRDELESLLPTWIGKDHLLLPPTASGVRLVESQIPMYTVGGDVTAYVYIGYTGKEPVPTFEEIEREAWIGVRVYELADLGGMFAVNVDFKRLLEEHYPYAVTCAYGIIGVNDLWPSSEYCAGIPQIIVFRPKAEDAAAIYFRTRDVEFVRYIYCSALQGYEYSYAGENIIVPYDRGTVDVTGIIERTELEKKADEYVWPIRAGAPESYFGLWQKILSEYYQVDFSGNDE